MPKIIIPNNIIESFKLNTPKIRGFYKHKNSEWLDAIKDKYKICY